MNMRTATYQGLLRDAFCKHYRESTDEWTTDSQMRVFPRLVQSHLRLPPSTRALDIGCGSGSDVAYLASLYKHVVGIDIIYHSNWDGVCQGESNPLFQCVDLLSFCNPFLFDLILDNGCFHHQHPEHYDAYLRRVASLLHSEGFFALSTFKNESISERVDENGRLHKYFTDSELHDMLSARGFVVLHEQDVFRPAKLDHYRVTLCRAHRPYSATSG